MLQLEFMYSIHLGVVFIFFSALLRYNWQIKNYIVKGHVMPNKVFW